MLAPSVVRAKAKAEFSSSLAGTIVALPFKEGSAFSKGDVLATLDCAVQRAQAEAAAADYQAARADFDAREALLARGARARQRLAEAVVEGCEVKAPFDGRIVEVSVNEFEYVEPSQPLLSIVSTERPEVEISAPSVWLRRIEVGSTGTVRFDEAADSFQIQITGIGATVDPISATIRLTAAFKGSVNGILPGMSGRASFE